MRGMILMLVLAACGEPMRTPEGCPVMISDAGKELMRACQQAFYEEQARKTGQPITRCFGPPGAMSCTTQ